MTDPIRARFGTDFAFGSLNLSLSLKDVVVGILNGNDLLNHLIILDKLCI